MNPSNPAPNPVAGVLGLHELPRNVEARVSGFRAAGNGDEQDMLLRLAELGFLPGEPVRVTAHGFAGRDPLAVRLGRTTFALRRHEAALLQVSLVAQPIRG